MRIHLEDVFEERIINSKNETLNGILTIIFYFLVFSVFLDVAGIFRNVWRRSPGWKARGDAAKIRRRQIYLFLALAVVSFFIVNAFRFNDLKLRVAQWKDFAHEIWPRVERKAHSTIAEHKQMPNSGVGRTYLPDLPRAEITHYLHSLVDPTRKQVLRVIREKLPFFDQRWFRSSQSIWGHFKVFALDGSKFWWLQQWFTGYVAWAVFVGIQCRDRGLPRSAGFYFTILAYLVGLAGVQCLFYALLLLKPKSTKPRLVWFPKAIVAIALFAAQVAGTASLPWLLSDVFEETGYLIFNMVHLVLTVQPTAVMLLFDQFPDMFGVRRGKAGRSGQVVVEMWFTAALLALGLHVYSTRIAYRESENASHHFWNMLGLHPKTGAWRSNTEHLKHTSQSIFGALGDYHYSASLGSDVLLSAVGLCCWAAITSASVRSMLKCSICPWIDDGSAGIDEFGAFMRENYSSRGSARRVTSAPNPAIDDEAGHGADDFGAYLRQFEVARNGTLKRRKGARTSSYAGEMLQDDEEDHEEEHPPRSRRGRPPKSTSRPTSRSRSQGRKVSQSQGRPKSRSRASVSPVKRNASTSSRRRSSRIRDMADPEDSESEAYSLRRSMASTMEALSGEAEAAGLTWGLFVLGGLGMASAAVLGSEELY